MRFSDETIRSLLEWQWWTLPISDLRNIAAQFDTKGLWTVDQLMKQVEAQIADERFPSLQQRFAPQQRRPLLRVTVVRFTNKLSA